MTQRRPLDYAERRLLAALLVGLGVFLLLAALLSTAHAQVGAPTDCSGTVGASDTVVTLSHTPSMYLTVIMVDATNTAWINPNGTAAANTPGSFPMTTVGAGWSWAALKGYPVPLSFHIIGSGAGTKYTCKYQ